MLRYLQNVARVTKAFRELFLRTVPEEKIKTLRNTEKTPKVLHIKNQ